MGMGGRGRREGEMELSMVGGKIGRRRERKRRSHRRRLGQRQEEGDASECSKRVGTEMTWI